MDSDQASFPSAHAIVNFVFESVASIEWVHFTSLCFCTVNTGILCTKEEDWCSTSFSSTEFFYVWFLLLQHDWRAAREWLAKALINSSVSCRREICKQSQLFNLKDMIMRRIGVWRLNSLATRSNGHEGDFLYNKNLIPFKDNSLEIFKFKFLDRSKLFAPLDHPLILSLFKFILIVDRKCIVLAAWHRG